MFAEEVKDFQPSIEKCSSGSVPELGTGVTEETEIYSLSLKEPQSFGGRWDESVYLQMKRCSGGLSGKWAQSHFQRMNWRIARWMWKGKEAMGREIGW